jgi:hypothetical protein
MSLSDEELTAIEQRAAKATPDEWRRIEAIQTLTDFANAARSDVPALVARVRELEAALLFYARRENWRERDTFSGRDFGVAYEDGGETARAVLGGPR